MAKGYSARKGFSGGAGMMQQQAQMQQQQNGGLDMQTAQAVIQRAQQDAARDSGQTMGANAPV